MTEPEFNDSHPSSEPQTKVLHLALMGEGEVRRNDMHNSKMYIISAPRYFLKSSKISVKDTTGD